MKICFPVEKNDGLESTVFNHFGSAPFFLLVDVATGEVTEVRNRDLDHAHGSCQPLKALSNHPVDAVVVGGIGGGALSGLTRANIAVYRAKGATISENLTLLAKGALERWLPSSVCGGHGGGNSCAH
jgi:predicted Fe-Mo cluster-binding NifX family protein